jgi:hypothetical protein
MSDSCGWHAVNAWVAAHRDRLPQTLEDLAKYPMAYRRAIQGAVAPEVRSGFWCDHLRSFLGPDSALSDAQKALVLEIIAEMPGMFALSRLDGQSRALELERRVIPLFDRALAGRIFAQLGPPEPPGGLPAPAD